MNLSPDETAGCRCPECGALTAERGVPPASGWTSWRYVVPLICMIGVALVIATGFWEGRTRYSQRPNQDYGRPVALVEPGFSVAQLRRIAEGEPGPASLTGALLDRSNLWLVRPPGSEFLQVQFHPRDGTSTERRFYGWPIPMVSTVRTEEFADVVARTPLSEDVISLVRRRTGGANDPMTEARWDSGRITVVRGGEKTPFSQDVASFNLVAAVGCLLFPVLAWYTATYATRLLARRARDRRRLGRIAGTTAGVLTAASLILVGVLVPQVDRTTTPVSYTLRSSAGGGGALSAPRLHSLTWREIEQMQGAPDADRDLAKRLLNAATGLPNDWLLSVAFYEDSTRGGDDLVAYSPWPLLDIQTVRRWHVDRFAESERAAAYSGYSPTSAWTPPPTGEQITWPPAGSLWRLQDGQLLISMPRSAPTQELRAVTIDLGGALFCCFLIWLAWIVARLLCYRRAALITSRRVAANQCVVCGYSLAGADTPLTPTRAS